MAEWQGSRTKIVLIEETTLGQTPATPTGVALPKASVAPAIGRRWVDNPTIPGDRLPQKKLRGRLEAGARITAPLHYETAGYLLKHGVATPTTSGTGPYTHTGTLGGALPVGAEIEVQHQDAAQYLLLRGLRFDTLGLRFADTGVLQAEIDAPGLDYVPWSGTPTVASPTEPTEDPIDLTYATVQIDAGTVGYLMGLEINVAQGVDRDKYTVGNSGKRYTLARGVAAVTGRLDFLVEDTTLLSKAEQGQEITLSVAVNQGASAQLTLDIANAQVSIERYEVNDAGALVASITFTAYGANALSYTLVNTTAAY